MTSLGISDNTRAVLDATRRALPAVAREAEKDTLKALRRRVGPKTLQVAKGKTPKVFRILEASGTDKNIPKGVRISFGGPASRYAARQHNSRTLSHSGQRSGKWVYEGKRSPHPGDLNPPRGSGISRTFVTNLDSRRTREIWTLKGLQVKGGTGGVGWWRFKSVIYHRRHPAVKFPKVGQRNFLHGAPNSALEETADFRERTLAKGALTGARRALRRATSGMAAGGGA